MHSQSILAGMQEGDFLTSIDLMEAYLHIPILFEHRQFLRFCYGDVTVSTGPCHSTFPHPLGHSLK